MPGIPDGWTPPAYNAPSPLGVTKDMLIAWLKRHQIIEFAHDNPTVMWIVDRVELKYNATCPTTGGSHIPATWDVWKFVADNERIIRGGQKTLFALDEE